VKKWYLDKLTVYLVFWVLVLLVALGRSNPVSRVGVTLVSWWFGVALLTTALDLEDDRQKYYRVAGGFLLVFGTASFLVSLYS
jgi:hypothetical protein